MFQAATRVRLLKILLRIAGAITASALLAVVLPVEWMASTHARLGLGEFPRAPIVDYLARSIAGLYAFHGILLLLVSSDPVKYASIVTYIAWVNIAFGCMLLGIDLHAGMPNWWTYTEGPPIVLFGILVLVLNRRESS